MFIACNCYRDVLHSNIHFGVEHTTSIEPNKLKQVSLWSFTCTGKSFLFIFYLDSVRTNKNSKLNVLLIHTAHTISIIIAVCIFLNNFATIMHCRCWLSCLKGVHIVIAHNTAHTLTTTMASINNEIIINKSWNRWRPMNCKNEHFVSLLCFRFSFALFISRFTIERPNVSGCWYSKSAHSILPFRQILLSNYFRNIKKPFIEIRNYLNLFDVIKTGSNAIQTHVPIFDLMMMMMMMQSPVFTKLLREKKINLFGGNEATWHPCINRLKSSSIRPAATSISSSSFLDLFFLEFIDKILVKRTSECERGSEKATYKWQTIYFQVLKIGIKINFKHDCKCRGNICSLETVVCTRELKYTKICWQIDWSGETITHIYRQTDGGNYKHEPRVL